MSAGSQETSPSTLDVAKFQRRLSYTSCGAPSRVLRDMGALREFDAHQESRMTLWMFVGVAGIALLVVAFLLAAADNMTAAVVVAVAGLLTAVVGFGMRAMHSRLNLDNRRYEIVDGLVNLLSKDMPADQAMDIKLDFLPHDHKKKFVRKGKISYWNVKFFVDRWLQMRGRFLDGTKYTVSVIEKRQLRSRTKRSASGKLKYKSKTKTASEAIVSLKIKSKRYPNADQSFRDLKGKVKLPPWVTLKSITAQGDELTIRATTNVPWEGGRSEKYDGVHWIAMMFMNLYQVLNSAK